MSTANQKPTAGPIPTAVQLPAERVVKAPSVAMRRARVIRSGDASKLSV